MRTPGWGVGTGYEPSVPPRLGVETSSPSRGYDNEAVESGMEMTSCLYPRAVWGFVTFTSQTVDGWRTTATG